MSKATKWLLITAMIAVPTLGFAVTRYRAHHKACPIKSDCPCEKSKR